MKLLSRKSGFSLIELLTVIAIIAILAAVIFPVMGMVKERARQNNCISNLKQIAMGVQMFKQDNRRYPEFLVDPETTTATVIDNAKSDKTLFSEYVKAIRLMHCPSSVATSTATRVSYQKFPYAADPVVNGWAYDSYSYGPYVIGASPRQPHYCIKWAPDVAAVATFTTDPGMPDDSATQQQDYERQLQFRNPPGDTVVTWCSFHEIRGEGSIVRGKAIVVFLDGSCDVMEAGLVENSKWRVRPKKG
ncbi:MAG: prepilin-type N-terminal cleavage/methylation domain-containing protein [Armatimonadetes bacterium]|nr:prepilin-type N-terminal cleavage/methylation domain-containing protein [Armatimonadota bacterium]